MIDGDDGGSGEGELSMIAASSLYRYEANTFIFGSRFTNGNTLFGSYSLGLLL